MEHSVNPLKSQLSVSVPKPLKYESRNSIPGTMEEAQSLAPLSSPHIVSSKEDRNVGPVTISQSPINLESPAKMMQPPGTPLTPTTNLKMLVAAASALDKEKAVGLARRELLKEDSFNDSCTQQTSGRKMKSLSLLCDRFLTVAENEIGAGKEFSLEMMANSLGTNRRRIYDIINVMEALEMISKQSKNWYKWIGRSALITTLARLKATAFDDPDIRPYLEHEQIPPDNVPSAEDDKENNGSLDQSAGHTSWHVTPKGKLDQSSLKRLPLSEVSPPEETDESSDFIYCDSVDYTVRSVRIDKSLGVLCQKFVMLFLVTPDNEVTLEEAGRILVPDSFEDTVFASLNPPVNPKTKVRRLYDIANILTSLGLIKKKTFVGPHHMKKPGYTWSGPNTDEIEAIPLTRKSDISKHHLYMKKGVIRKPALTAPTYEIPGQFGSAPNTPVKVKGGSFKRSLSFSAGSGPSSGSKQCVLARPLCPKQIDYVREMREFEAEIQRHSHRYPHVASVFHEFIKKYQGTLEQAAAANGRFILPKSASNLETAVPLANVSPSSSHSTQTTPSHSRCASVSTSDVKPKLLGAVTPTHPVDLAGFSPLSHEQLLAQIALSSTPVSTHHQLPVAQVPTAPLVPGPCNASLAYPNNPQNSSTLQQNSSINTADILASCSPLIQTVPPSSNPMVTNLANSILASVFNGLHNTGVFEQHQTPQPNLATSSNTNQGTLISPAKSANNSFVRVEDFLVPIQSSSHLDVPHASRLLSERSLPNFTHLASQPQPQPTSCPNSSVPMRMTNLGSLVSQKAIPAAVTISAYDPSLTQQPSIVNISSHTSINPTSFLATNTTAKELYPKASRKGLALTHSDASYLQEMTNISPPKRPRLQ